MHVRSIWAVIHPIIGICGYHKTEAEALKHAARVGGKVEWMWH